MNRFSKILIAILAPLLLTGWSAPANTQERITPLADSRIWIEGQSNIKSFTCHAESFEGSATVNRHTENSALSAEIRIPVNELDCGRSRMNRDLFDALRGDEYDSIQFSYTGATIVSVDENYGYTYLIEVQGVLEVAGVQRSISFAAECYIRDGDRIRILGNKSIRMTDYDVEPPTGLLGLVRARNELTVHFDIHADGGGVIQQTNTQ